MTRPETSLPRHEWPPVAGCVPGDAPTGGVSLSMVAGAALGGERGGVLADELLERHRRSLPHPFHRVRHGREVALTTPHLEIEHGLRLPLGHAALAHHRVLVCLVGNGDVTHAPPEDAREALGDVGERQPLRARDEVDLARMPVDRLRQRGRSHGGGVARMDVSRGAGSGRVVDRAVALDGVGGPQAVLHEEARLQDRVGDPRLDERALRTSVHATEERLRAGVRSDRRELHHVRDPGVACLLDEAAFEIFHALVDGSEEENAVDAPHRGAGLRPLREVSLEQLDLGRQDGRGCRPVADEGAHAAAARERLLHDFEPVRSGGAGHQHRHGSLLVPTRGGIRTRRGLPAWATCLTPVYTLPGRDDESTPWPVPRDGPHRQSTHRLSASCVTEALTDGDTSVNGPLWTHARWLGAKRGERSPSLISRVTAKRLNCVAGMKSRSFDRPPSEKSSRSTSTAVRMPSPLTPPVSTRATSAL